jgi:hypothetical protein
MPQSQRLDPTPALTAGGAHTQSGLRDEDGGGVGCYSPSSPYYYYAESIKLEGVRAPSTHAYVVFLPAPITDPPLFRRCQRVAGASGMATRGE